MTKNNPNKKTLRFTTDLDHWTLFHKLTKHFPGKKTVNSFNKMLDKLADLYEIEG